VFPVRYILNVYMLFRRNSVFKVFMYNNIITYIHSVCTSQETHHFSTTKPNRLMLFREAIVVYRENHTEHTNTLCG
jgi:hypothetical protein